MSLRIRSAHPLTAFRGAPMATFHSRLALVSLAKLHQ
jgi:hypothetical protein